MGLYYQGYKNNSNNLVYAVFVIFEIPELRIWVKNIFLNTKMK